MSYKFAVLWADDQRNKVFLDLGGYLRKLALRVPWPSFGNTSVLCDLRRFLQAEILRRSIKTTVAGLQAQLQ
jgi:hypothetical protein